MQQRLSARRALAEAPASSRAATTLVVAPAHDDASAFVRLAQSVGDELRAHGLAVDVLAFHPGASTRRCPAPRRPTTTTTRHYAAREPVPDAPAAANLRLGVCACEWAERGDGMPGALGLLVENRRRLRRQTLPALAARLRGWRAVGDGTRAAAPRMMAEEGGGGGTSGGRLGGRVEPPPPPPPADGGGDGGGGAVAAAAALALLLGIGRFVLGFGDSNVAYYEYSSTTSTTVNGVGDDGKPKVETRRSSSMRTNVPGLAERSAGSEDGGGGGAEEGVAVGWWRGRSFRRRRRRGCGRCCRETSSSDEAWSGGRRSAAAAWRTRGRIRERVCVRELDERRSDE